MSDKQYDTKHHRCPESLNGKSEQRNISIVPANKHRAWHLLFKNHPPNIIAEIINKTWIDPDYEIIVVLRKKKVRRQY